MIKKLNGDWHVSDDGKIWFNIERTRMKPIIKKTKGGKRQNGKRNQKTN